MQQEAVHTHSTMSVEDEDPDFLSDEDDQDDEAEGDDDDSEVVSYSDLFLLHRNLMRFDNIYLNAIMVDMTVGRPPLHLSYR